MAEISPEGTTRPKSTQDVSASSPGSKPHYIVGLGASAGGLEALEQFFAVMPPDSGMSFVVVQHLSPDFRSLMDELLAHRTSMPIHQATNGVQLEPNAIYLMPPKKEMILSGGKLLLTDKDQNQALTLPIDKFFRSLAQDAQEKAIAVVLSGTGSDGSRGIRDIRKEGGLVAIQSLESAKFDGMPKSSIDTGAAHLILSPGQIPGAILQHIQHPAAHTAPQQANEIGAENGLARVFKLLRRECGIDFAQYKPSTVTRRIERRLTLRHIQDFDEYVEELERDPVERDALYKDLLIGVTKFFRDADAFRRLETEVIPDILRRNADSTELRFWVPACGTGEEAYSIAILLREQLDRIQQLLDVKIFATDVHKASIDFASSGVYSEESLSEVDAERRGRYFKGTRHGFQVNQEIRQMIVFAPHNIISDAPFTKLDFISCRNLLIYFQPHAQKKALSLFHFGLKPGGVLFLGPSESPSELADEFDTIDAHWRIYRKQRDSRLPADLRLPLPSDHSSMVWPRSNGSSHLRGQDNDLRQAYDVLLQDFMPPAVLINNDRELIHSFGGAEELLRLKSGRTTANVIELIDRGLKLPLSSVLHRLEKDAHQEAVVTGATEDGRRIQLAARLIPDRNGIPNFVLVTFEDLAANPQREETETLPCPVDLEQASSDRIDLLENELRYTKENLQATVEELETSNEELQAANEELVASNEELQSTNEELHSVNEELYTVNAEYQRKISELTQLNSDMDNLLRSTEIGTIFLDRDLFIRKFTPQISRLFNLVPQDVGRRIDTFAQNIDEPNLLEHVQGVLASSKTFEKEVRGREGDWYLLRILPYKNSADETLGAVLTLIDVTALKKTQEQLKEVHRQLQGILDNSSTFICVKDLNGQYMLGNRASEVFLGTSCDSIRGKTDYDFFRSDIADSLQSHDREVARTCQVMEFEEVIPAKHGERTYLSVKFPLRDERSRVYGVGSICTDITDRKKAEDSQRIAVKRRDQFLAMLSHELRNPLTAMTNAIELSLRDSDAATAGEFNRIIQRQAKQMSRLIDDLLDVSRVTQGKIDLRTEVVDLRTTARDATNSLEPTIAKRGQTLHVKLPEEPLYVEADPARLLQVQVNLLSNASKYNADGGNVWLSVLGTERDAIVTVRDDGDGIPQELQESVFDLFVQADATKARSDGGLGVGLTLVKAIVEKSAGEIGVHSDGPGLGSTFTVRLPLTAKHPALENPRSRTRAAVGKTIVIVEDNSDARDTLASLLRLDGFEVQTAADGRSGLKAISRYRPDVALVDIALPLINGLEFAREARANPELDRTILIAVTGYGQEADREATSKAGFDAHFVKPLDVSQLYEFLEEHRQAVSEKAN